MINYYNFDFQLLIKSVLFVWPIVTMILKGFLNTHTIKIHLKNALKTQALVGNGANLQPTRENWQQR